MGLGYKIQNPFDEKQLRICISNKGLISSFSSRLPGGAVV